MHYIESTHPVLRIAFVEQSKKNLTLVKDEAIRLEPYQVEKGIIKDEKVLSEKVMQIAGTVEGKVKDGVHIVIDSPRVLNYSVILPKMNVKKAVQMAGKELEETFPMYDEYYAVRNEATDAKEKGVFVYYELMPKDIISSFTTICELMDMYIDSVNLGKTGLLSQYSESGIDEDNLVIIYGDTHVTLVGLMLGRKIVETRTYYAPLTHDDDLFANIGLGIRMMSGKHEFHYERRRAKSLMVICSDNDAKHALEQFLSEGYALEPVVVENEAFKDFLEVFLKDDDYADHTFKVDT
jgi:hypothetical protein